MHVVISKAKINKYALLRHKKFRREYGLFPAEGTNTVFDLLPAFTLENLIATPDWISFHNGDIPDHVWAKVLEASPADIKKISSLSTPSDVIAVFRLPDYAESFSAPLPEGFYLVLDGVQDPGNLGTIIRTAHWFGIDRIFCAPDSADAFNPKTVQASMGSLSHVKVIYGSLHDLFAANPSLPRYGLDLRGDNIFTSRGLKPGFLVMGREGSGLRPEVREDITSFLNIPPSREDNHPDSLNVAVATAITLSQLLK